MVVERNRVSQRSHGVASQRSYGVESHRSYGTSSSSSQGSRAKCKDCCRKFVSFMCTQVGVGGLLVSYALLGAFAFQKIEEQPEHWPTNCTVSVHNSTIENLWEITERLNVLNQNRWQEDVNRTLYKFQDDIVHIIMEEKCDGRSFNEVWNYPAALMFCLSVFTMIGYGQMYPRTEWGKIATIMYACFGIPLYVVYFMNMGRIFAKSFKYLYRLMYRCFNQSKSPDAENGLEVDGPVIENPVIIVPSTACIWVMILYMAGGTIMFAVWEGWTYLNSCYFSFTSLAKIGFGDIVPGFKGGGGGGVTNQSKVQIIVNFLYLLVGMGLIAMCYTLMKEEILMKLRALKQDIREKMFYCGLKLGLYPEETEPIQPPPMHPMRTRSIRKFVRRR